MVRQEDMAVFPSGGGYFEKRQGKKWQKMSDDTKFEKVFLGGWLRFLQIAPSLN
jgi:hypothetical protein